MRRVEVLQVGAEADDSTVWGAQFGNQPHPSAATRCDKGGLVDGTGRRSSDSFLKLPTLRLCPLQACGDLELCASDGRSRLAVGCGGAVICDWAVLVLSNGDEPLNLLDGEVQSSESVDEIVQRPLLPVISSGQAGQVLCHETGRDEEPLSPVDLRVEVPVVADPVAARADTLRDPLQERRAGAARESLTGLMQTLGSGGREHQRGEAGLQTLVVALVAGTTAGVAAARCAEPITCAASIPATASSFTSFFKRMLTEKPLSESSVPCSWHLTISARIRLSTAALPYSSSLRYVVTVSLKLSSAAHTPSWSISSSDIFGEEASLE